MATTPIEWTATVQPDGTVTPGRVWNPVTGCHKISPGCKFCYAEGIAKRFWATQYPRVQSNPLPDQFKAGAIGAAGDAATAALEEATMRPREFTDVQTHDDRLMEPLSWRKPCRVFVNSMSDLFEEAVPFEFIDRVFAVMVLCPHITFQVLTKRADRMRDYMSHDGTRERVADVLGFTHGRSDAARSVLGDKFDRDPKVTWPLRNVWLGTSVENQKYADERIPLLLQTPAAIRFISAEPLLGPVDLRCGYWLECEPGLSLSTLDWVIIGGESGPSARTFDTTFARSIVKQCADAGVACFVKQLGAKPEAPTPGAWNSAHREPMILRDRKGGDMAEWPADLRVRNFPTVTA